MLHYQLPRPHYLDYPHSAIAFWRQVRIKDNRIDINYNLIYAKTMPSEFATYLKKTQISGQVIRSLLCFLTSQGIDVASIKETFQVEDGKLNQSDSRFNGGLYNQLLYEGADRTGDNLLGFHFGAEAEPDRWGLLGYIMTFCSHLSEALTWQKKYQSLVGTIGETSINVADGRVTLSWMTPVKPSRHMAEEVPTGWVRFARWITQTNLGPLEVHFRHSKPVHAMQIDAFFGVPVTYNSNFTGLVFPSDYLNLPLKQPDEDMLSLLGVRIKQVYSNLSPETRFLEQFNFALIKMMPHGAPTIENIAKELGLGVRTLQRRLKDHDTCFSDELDLARKNLALSYFDRETINLSELSFQLGFSEQSSFQRAFKRWTGVTPGKFSTDSQH